VHAAAAGTVAHGEQQRQRIAALRRLLGQAVVEQGRQSKRHMGQLQLHADSIMPAYLAANRRHKSWDQGTGFEADDSAVVFSVWEQDRKEPAGRGEDIQLERADSPTAQHAAQNSSDDEANSSDDEDDHRDSSAVGEWGVPGMSAAPERR
jgi:hypothetical protein